MTNKQEMTTNIPNTIKTEKSKLSVKNNINPLGLTVLKKKILAVEHKSRILKNKICLSKYME